MTQIWHNPRCSKSRQTLALLEEHGEDVAVRRYLDDAPTEAELRAALAALNATPIEIMRKGEKVFKDLGLSADTPEDDLIAAMLAHPVLIERPIVLKDGKARMGRPPESVLEIL
ncbi:arsenate reductase [Aliiroseovarius halocynthiae]|uniref:Arsenate reductase n=1 Tax=Aliiroseovarius halocynthiae TaxID=985055 RepID=A0A545SR58_9RHOB|nr:arsenate reductase (glutaredoxin) [Aliiroseovarius halocynthiae]TQV67442.1 arsenate reductase (glutaredoxin) [Aliiroseovarius halocynthiae]SMR81449.1 arsenate reductase [Aliiroseovarius halocynthiae]